MSSAKRFVQIENNAQYPADDETTWWWDTARPWKDAAKDGQPYIAVQMYRDKDPNTYRPIHEAMHLLFTDQTEYYVVCQPCFQIYRRQQWSGTTQGGRNWQEAAEAARVQHQREKGWCEFCDPIFGNRGWRQ